MRILSEPFRYFPNFPVSVFIILIAFGCAKKKEQTKAERGTITESVYASARIKAEDQYNIYPTLSGTLTKVLVEAGDTVQEDQALFALDNVASELNSENALLALQLSEENAEKGSARLKELEASLTLAKEKLALDQDQFRRQKNLWAQGVGSKSELDQKQLALDNSKANLDAAKSRLDQTKTQLNNELQRARNSYKISKKQSRDFVIRSIRKGRIFDVLKKEGEVVNTQTALAIAGNGNRFLIEMEVDQTDITRIKIGQMVTLTMDSYKGQVFEAELTKVYPIMDERTRTFKVEARFKKEPPSLYPNLTAEANIIVFTKPDALTIPRNYLAEGKYVWVGKDEKKEVTVGLKDYQKAEILSGIDSSTVIYKP